VEQVWVAVISVTGALLGSLMGSWMTAKVSRQAQELTISEQHDRQRREAFCEALNALLAYRSREIKRAAEAHESGRSIDEVPAAGAAREARSSCRYHLVVLRVLMPGEDVPRRYSELLDLAHQISDLPADASIEVATRVKSEIEDLATDFGERSPSRLGARLDSK
jgi:HAMP domain-containing protein